MPQLLDAFGDLKWNQLFKSYEPNYCYDDKEHILNGYYSIIPKYIIDNCGLFTAEYSDILIDDQFEGTYKDVPLRIAEIHIKGKIQGTTRGDIPCTIFKGIVFSFKFNKKIKSQTVICSKQDFGTTKHNFLWFYLNNLAIILHLLIMITCYILVENNRILIGCIIAIYAYLLFAGRNIFEKQKISLKKIKLEDIKFNKRFNVYSSNEVEARYLVTPLFMELLNNLKTSFGNRKLKCSFCDDTLLIAISTNKDLFEIGSLYTSCYNLNFFLQFYRELSSIYKMVEYFKLNSKIYFNK